MTAIVQLSKFAYITTLLINFFLIVCCALIWDEKTGFWFICVIWLLLLIFGLLYGPTQIIANPKYILVKSRLLKQRIAMIEIESVELFQPTIGTYRLCASGGYFGYWGIFRDGTIGKYTAYYGKTSDCFLIKMKNGSQYVLGCQNPDIMVAYIKNYITKI